MWNCTAASISFVWLFLSLLSFLAVISAYIYYFQAVRVLCLWKWHRRWRAGLKKRCLKITDELQISYLERKGDRDGQVLLFVHGFTGDKDIFCDIAGYMPAKFHVILIDLPGHGESKPNDEKSDYRPSVLVDCVHQFVEAYGFGKKRLNIIGSSMGGAIVGVYAARYRHDESLSSTVLVCPAGIHSPELTEFMQKTRNDLSQGVKENLLIPNTSKEFYDMVKLVMYHKINIPSPIGKAFLKLKQMKAGVYKKVLSDMNVQSEYLLLDKALKDIEHPVLCVWGENDEVLHVTGCDIIRERVKDAEIHIFDRCGHVIAVDRPRKLVKTITQFLERVATN